MNLQTSSIISILQTVLVSNIIKVSINIYYILTFLDIDIDYNDLERRSRRESLVEPSENEENTQLTPAQTSGIYYIFIEF